MYWNPIENYDRYEDISININMRCIEICEFNAPYNHRAEININMRCIEILLLLLQELFHTD